MSISGTRQLAVLTLIVAAGLATPPANAEEGERGGRRGGPPPEAFEACASQTQDAACSFEGRRGAVEGYCIVPPRGEEQLVCAPEGGPPDRRPENDEPGD